MRSLLLPAAAAGLVGCAQSAAPPAAATAGVQRDSLEWTDSVLTRAAIWSPVAQPDTDLPTLIFSPGFGALPSHYSTLLSRWAGEGYLVIGIAHPHFPNPDAMELYDASNTIARQLVRAVAYILSDRDRPGSPFSRVDPERIGLVGHSVGGSASAQAAAWNPRVRAAMDLDGTIFGDVVHTGMPQPFFLMRKRYPIDPNDPPQFFEHRDQGNLHEDSVFVHATTMYWLTVDSMEHMAFTDADSPWRGGNPSRLARLAAGDDRLEASRIQEIATRFVVDFFGHYLSGVPRSGHLDQSPFPGTHLRFKR
jgi:dienelactone hydrolase